MRVLFWVAAYLGMAAVTSACMVHALHEYSQKEWPLITGDQPDVDEFMIGLLFGLLWPVMLPCLVMFRVAMRLYHFIYPPKEA